MFELAPLRPQLPTWRLGFPPVSPVSGVTAGGILPYLTPWLAMICRVQLSSVDQETGKFLIEATLPKDVWREQRSAIKIDHMRSKLEVDHLR